MLASLDIGASLCLKRYFGKPTAKDQVTSGPWEPVAPSVRTALLWELNLVIGPPTWSILAPCWETQSELQGSVLDNLLIPHLIVYGNPNKINNKEEADYILEYHWIFHQQKANSCFPG